MVSRTATLTFLGKDAVSGVTRKVEGSLGRLHKSAGRLGGGFARLAGAGIGGLMGGLTSLQGLLIGGGIIAGLSAAASAAAEDEASVARLTTAIDANVAGHGNYTAALEETIAKGQALAFTDDQTRASLARLVVSTKDVEEATKLNAIAMDLARLKGIDLEAAANLVAKAHDGNYTALKKLGIEIPKGATALEALTAVQKAAAGQADAYSNTQRGALDRVKIGFDELMEGIGRQVIPLLDNLQNLLTTTVAPAIAAVAGAIGKWIDDNQPLITQIKETLATALQTLGKILNEQVLPFVQKVADAMSKLFDNVIKPALDVILPVLGDILVNVVIPAIQALWDITSKVIDVLSQLFDKVIKPAVDAILPPLRTVLDGIGAAFRIVKDAVDALIEPIRTVLDLAQKAVAVLATLAGLTGANAQGNAVAQAQAAYDAWKLSHPGETLQSAIDAGLRASGGPVARGRAYIVGERGPEMFVPGSNGTIVPNGGRGIVLNTYMTVMGSDDPDAWSARYVAGVARRLRRERIIG